MYTYSTVLSTVVEAMKWPYNYFCTIHQLLSVFSKYLVNIFVNESQILTNIFFSSEAFPALSG